MAENPGVGNRADTYRRGPHVPRIAETLRKIEAVNADLHCVVEVLSPQALADAGALDREQSIEGDLTSRRPLLGVPVGVKELFDVRGVRSTYGSLVPDNEHATEDSAVVERLREAGAVVVAVTRSHEFGWGITTHHEQRGTCRNPLNVDLVAGGSSGGSAAAVAAGLVPLAVGTDTGGSIRIPAAFCGVLGLKTTPGMISRRGCVPLAGSFDTPGLFANSISLIRDGLAALAGPDQSEDFTLSERVETKAYTSGLSVAAPVQLQPQPLSAQRRRALEMTMEALGDLGAVRAEVPVPSVVGVSEIFVPIMMAEALAVHRNQLGFWPERTDRYGSDLRARLRSAERVTMGAYTSALHAADQFRTNLRAAFENVDVLVSVVGAAGPSRVDDPDWVEIEGQRVSLLEAMMPSTLPQNLAGLPSLTIPVWTDDGGLPIGIQLTGAPWTEWALIEVGQQLNEAGFAQVHSTERWPLDLRRAFA